MAGKTGLTAKQQKFVDNYLVSLNATEAALEAKYSKKSAGKIGFQLLENTRIQTAIEKALKKQQERTEISADKVISELSRVAFLNLAQAFGDDGLLLDISKMPEDMQRAIAGMDIETKISEEGASTRTKKIKTNDKLKALELLGRHFKMFTDRQEVSGPNGGPIMVGGPALLDYDEWERKAKAKLQE